MIDIKSVIIGIIVTGISYNLIPIILRFFMKKIYTEKQAKKIAIINAIVVHIIFMIIYLGVLKGSASTGSIPILWILVSYYILKPKKDEEIIHKNNETKSDDKKKTNITISIIVLVLVLAILVVLCVGYAKKATTKIQNPIATMEVENYGTIKIELYPKLAPNTVTNFIKLANNGYYNGLKFHRVIKDFMIQGGDSSGDGSGSAKLKDLYQNEEDTAYSIEGEFNANGHRENDLNLTEGTVAMARADYTQYSPNLAKQSYNSAGTQFFIMTTNNHTNLSGYYAGFGKVIEGMDVVKKIAEVKVKKADNSEQTGSTEESVPKKDVKIKSVTVETFGMDYGFPKTMEPFNYMNWLYGQYGMSQ